MYRCIAQEFADAAPLALHKAMSTEAYYFCASGGTGGQRSVDECTGEAVRLLERQTASNYERSKPQATMNEANH